MNDARIYQAPSSFAADLPRPFVVVVDDERRIADTLVLILHTRGYAAAAAHDGASALEICREKAPDLLITDVVMPDMNGIDLAITICQRFRDCHILLFSGQAETADILEEARRRGYDFELLAKPLHPEELLSRIETLIGPPARQQPERR